MITELQKTFTSKKTYIAIIGLAFLPVLFLSSTDSTILGEVEKEISGGNLPNSDGWQLVVTSMNFAMHIFAPLLLAMVASDTIAGEASNGLLALSLSKPVSRSKYLSNKIITQAIVVFVIFIFFALTAFILGSTLGYNTFYGVGENGMPSLDVIIPEDEIWWRMLLFFSFAAFGSWVVSIVTIMISTFSNSVSTVTSITLIIYMFTDIFGSMIAGSENAIYLLSPAIKRFIWSMLYETVNWADIRESFLILLIYSTIILAIAYWRFNKRDI